jgi:hypothetical protein
VPLVVYHGGRRDAFRGAGPTSAGSRAGFAAAVCLTLAACAAESAEQTPSVPPGTPTSTPVLTAVSPTLTATPAPPTQSPVPLGPSILSLVADPEEVRPGQTVTLTWSSSGGAKAILQPSGVARLGEFVEVEPNGTTSVTVPARERYRYQFRLVVEGASGNRAESSRIVQLLCPYEFFFSYPPPARGSEGQDDCPVGPAAHTLAAEQVFERGRMVWLEAVPAESIPSADAWGPTILVFHTNEDPQVSGWSTYRYDDTWSTDEPESDPAIVPPPGLCQPVRGFGKVWRTEAEVRERLGWALAPEQGFEGVYQAGWDPWYPRGNQYLRTADGRVLMIGLMGSWEILQPAPGGAG